MELSLDEQKRMLLILQKLDEEERERNGEAKADPMSHARPLCCDCKHDRGDMTCLAFPSGIPRDITYGNHKHTKPYPGDNGILFEERKK